MQYYVDYNMVMPVNAVVYRERNTPIGDPMEQMGLGLATRNLGPECFHSQARELDGGATIQVNYGRNSDPPAVMSFGKLPTGLFFEYHPDCSIRQRVRGRPVAGQAGIILATSSKSKRGAGLPLLLVDNFLTIPRHARYMPLQAMLYRLAKDSRIGTVVRSGTESEHVVRGRARELGAIGIVFDPTGIEQVVSAYQEPISVAPAA